MEFKRCVYINTKRQLAGECREVATKRLSVSPPVRLSVCPLVISHVIIQLSDCGRSRATATDVIGSQISRVFRIQSSNHAKTAKKHHQLYTVAQKTGTVPEGVAQTLKY